MAAKLIGHIVRYLNQYSVGLVDITEDEILSLGDTVEIGNGYTQKVSYLEVNRRAVNQARRGDVAALKVDRQVSEGDMVYKL
ncbi:hypothetical protein M1116_03320 [Patescibacteria group bacterium]|nr:hypothetical protein [Patescibacteria group bacterium]